MHRSVRARAFGALWLLIAAFTAHAAQRPEQDPNLASANAVLVDLADGETLLAKHADVVVPIASVTKLMTAMVVLDSGADRAEWLTILDWDPKPANNAFSRIRIGSEARRDDLLRIALMSSENRAAHQLARHHPGGFDAFVAAMNAKAAALGMRDTHFVDPTGLAPGNRSTAADLAKMLIAAHGYETIREYSTTSQHDVRFRGPRYALGYGNTNPLVRHEKWDVEVTKTGYLSEAGRCLVMVAHVADRDVAMVFLNSFGKRSPLGDAGRVRRWLATGATGTVSRAARDYERSVTASWNRPQGSDASTAVPATTR